MFSSRCLPHLSQYLYVLYFFFSLSFSISLSVSVSICFCLRRIVYFRQFASIILICPMPLIFLKNFLRHCDLNPGWRLQCELPYTLDHSAIQTPPEPPFNLCLYVYLCFSVPVCRSLLSLQRPLRRFRRLQSHPKLISAFSLLWLTISKNVVASDYHLEKKKKSILSETVNVR